MRAGNLRNSSICCRDLIFLQVSFRFELGTPYRGSDLGVQMAIDVMFHISCLETWCAVMASDEGQPEFGAAPILFRIQSLGCLLYTSDAADEL